MIKRIIKSILILYITITITFFLMHVLPQNFIDTDDEISETLKEVIMSEYHLDKSIKEQYIIYLKNISRLDLGKSLKYPDKTVNSVIKENFPVSFELGLYVIVFSNVVGFSLAIYSVFTNFEKKMKLISSLFIALPSFVVVGLLQYYVVYIHNNLGIGRISILGFDGISNKILPVLSLSLFYIGIIYRICISKIKEESKKEYVKFLLSKGFDIKYIIRKHILINILTPLISILIPLFVSLVSGSFVVENLFGINGLGRYFTFSILDRDYNMVMGLTIFYTFLILSFFTIMDILIIFIDKRLKRGKL